MQFLKYCLFLSILCFSLKSYAIENQTFTFNNIDLSIENETTKIFKSKDIENLKYQIVEYQPFFNNYINKLIIHIHVFREANQTSVSNGNPYECVINLFYKDVNNPVLLSNMNHDLIFTILHEISHCILTKEVMYYPIDWKIPSYEQKAIQLLIDKKEKQFIKQKINVPPMLVYHEIFADTLATILLKKYNYKLFEVEINNLIKKRFSQYRNKGESHLSKQALIIIKNTNLDNMDNEKIYNLSIDIARTQFVIYLNKQ